MMDLYSISLNGLKLLQWSIQYTCCWVKLTTVSFFTDYERALHFSSSCDSSKFERCGSIKIEWIINRCKIQRTNLNCHFRLVKDVLEHLWLPNRYMHGNLNQTLAYYHASGIMYVLLQKLRGIVRTSAYTRTLFYFSWKWKKFSFGKIHTILRTRKRILSKYWGADFELSLASNMTSEAQYTITE